MKEERKEKILAFMQEAAYKPLLLKELAFVLDVPKTEMEAFSEIIAELENEGKIFKTHKDRYGVPERMNLVVGRLQGHERGFGFGIPDDENMKDIFIPAEAINGAMHNDRIVIRLIKKNVGDKKSEGEVIRILERANKTIVGTFESSRNFGFVTPDNLKISGDIFISKDEFLGAKSGQKVIVEIEKYAEKRRNAEGRIIEIIGNKGDVGTDILSIIKAYNLSESFPEEVLKQAEDTSEVVTEEMIKGRIDLRKLQMVTIDGEDAKDLDDAVSIELLPNGNYKLGVHIADVTHYVTEDSPLDQEALKRGTSVYLVDRVIPMLPKKLSNGICSLNPQVDRLAFTVMMEIDPTGKTVSHEIFESVININERMTYTNVYRILAHKDPELMARYDYLNSDFTTMEKLAMILRAKRFGRGAIDFDFDEAKIILDEKGKPIEVRRYENTIANKIIEEFMLVCNETVAEHFYWANSPFVYRIHEDPDSEKIENFNEFVHNFGLSLKGINKIHPKAYQDLLERVKGSKEERIISTVMLRSMQKARYSNVNQGHFGLAAKYYSHFTSPIRRYPDLIIHRIMKEQIKQGISERRENYLNSRLPEIAKQCSDRERAAEDAERDTEDLKKVEFMKEHEGETFKGIISNVTSFGMFIELDNTIEGLIHMSNMEDDYYIFNEKQYCLVGERTRKVYRIGEEVDVRLIKADLASRKMDFILVEGEPAESGETGESREISIQKNLVKKQEKKSNRRKILADPKVKRSILGKKPRKKKKR